MMSGKASGLGGGLRGTRKRGRFHPSRQRRAKCCLAARQALTEKQVSYFIHAIVERLLLPVYVRHFKSPCGVGEGLRGRWDEREFQKTDRIRKAQRRDTSNRMGSDIQVLVSRVRSYLPQIKADVEILERLIKTCDKQKTR
jgi:hypothetical protein